jgi:hypothetical protein
MAERKVLGVAVWDRGRMGNGRRLKVLGLVGLTEKMNGTQ